MAEGEGDIAGTAAVFPWLAVNHLGDQLEGVLVEEDLNKTHPLDLLTVFESSVMSYENEMEYEGQYKLSMSSKFIVCQQYAYGENPGNVKRKLSLELLRKFEQQHPSIYAEIMATFQISTASQREKITLEDIISRNTCHSSVQLLKYVFKNFLNDRNMELDVYLNKISEIPSQFVVHLTIFQSVGCQALHSASGTGSTKKEAKENAASSLLEWLASNEPSENLEKVKFPLLDYIKKLFEGFSFDEEFEVNILTRQFEWTMELDDGDLVGTGISSSKLMARAIAARELAFQLVERKAVPNPDTLNNLINQLAIYERPPLPLEAIFNQWLHTCEVPHIKADARWGNLSYCCLKMPLFFAYGIGKRWKLAIKDMYIGAHEFIKADPTVLHGCHRSLEEKIEWPSETYSNYSSLGPNLQLLLRDDKVVKWKPSRHMSSPPAHEQTVRSGQKDNAPAPRTSGTLFVSP